MEEQLPEEQIEVEAKKKMTLGDLLKNRKYVLISIGVFLLLITLTFIFFATRVANNLQTVTTKEQLNTTPRGAIYFEPSTLNVTPGKSYSVDVYLDTWGEAITGANVAVAYNKNLISNIALTQVKDKESNVSLAFGSAIAENNNHGVIALPLIMAETTPPQKGRGKVATLTFTAKPSNVTQSSFSFFTSTTFITRVPQNTIFLQKGNLIIYYPINGTFPTQAANYK